MKGPDERLVYMANQIARNFAVQGHAVAVAATTEHIARYWDPGMRARIAMLYPDADLVPIARDALATLL